MQTYDYDLKPENYSFPKPPQAQQAQAPASQPASTGNATADDLRGRYRTWQPHEHALVGHHIDEARRLGSIPFHANTPIEGREFIRAMHSNRDLGEHHLRAIGQHLGADVSNVQGRSGLVKAIGTQVGSQSARSFQQGDENWTHSWSGENGGSQWQHRGTGNTAIFHNYARPVGQTGDWLDTGWRNEEFPVSRSYYSPGEHRTNVTIHEDQEPGETTDQYRERQRQSQREERSRVRREASERLRQEEDQRQQQRSERRQYDDGIVSHLNDSDDMYHDEGMAEQTAAYMRGEHPRDFWGDGVSPEIAATHGQFPNAQADDILNHPVNQSHPDNPARKPKRQPLPPPEKLSAHGWDLHGHGMQAGASVFLEGKGTAEDLASLLGEPKGKNRAEVDVRGNKVMIKADNGQGHVAFSVAKDPAGKKYIHWDWAKNKEGAGKGVSADAMIDRKDTGKMFKNAKRLGISYIETLAARADSDDPKMRMTGYSAWINAGFDAKIDKKFKDKMLADGHTELAKADTFQELYSIPGGKKWWKEHGRGVELKADLENPNKRMTRLIKKYERGDNTPDAEDYAMAKRVQHEWNPSPEWDPKFDLPDDHPDKRHDSLLEYCEECERQDDLYFAEQEAEKTPISLDAFKEPGDAAKE